MFLLLLRVDQLEMGLERESFLRNYKDMMRFVYPALKEREVEGGPWKCGVPRVGETRGMGT